MAEYCTLVGNAATCCYVQVVNIGRLEMMIVDGWASDEERKYNDNEDTICSASCGTRNEV